MNIGVNEFGLHTKSDLLSLIENKIFENTELEYKNYCYCSGKFDKPKEKDKLMQEIAAFANTNGGVIVVGMEENNDRIPVRLSGTKMALGEYDNWLSSFREIVLSRIRPHLHGVTCNPIPVEGNDNIAIIITIPRSVARPHSYWDGNKDEFLMRHTNGIMHMDITDLRKAFLYANGLQDKIQQFTRERIALILANEFLGDLGSRAKFVIHIVPEWSFELGNSVNLRSVRDNKGITPISGNGWDDRYNADGYCVCCYDQSSNMVNAYTQLFHSGIIEATEIRLISGGKNDVVYNWRATQNAIICAVKRYCKVLEDFHIPKPWHFRAALLNAKGYITIGDLCDSSEPVERDIIYSQNGICTDEVSIDAALKVVFDSLSNAFGFSRSNCFDE